ncbi:MAG: hypothetical protein RIA69_20315 [Cyclobacteriaceae bacterium]
MEKFEYYNLTEEEINECLSKPETGMGFQVLYDNPDQIEDESNPILSNSELLFNFEEPQKAPIFSDFSTQKLNFNIVSKADFSVDLKSALRRKNIQVKINNKYSSTHSPTQPFPPYSYKTKNGDEFRRLSAFKNDRRIGSNGNLIKGSYGTTKSDLTVVPSGTAAVGRYALPNRIAACYIFQIIPPPGTLLYFGTVTPAYGLCGGGVEVYFPNGCPSNSVRLIGTLNEI